MTARASDPQYGAGAAELALCRSALYEALAIGFRPPSREIPGRLGGRAATGLVYAAAALDRATAGGLVGAEHAAGSLASLVRTMASAALDPATLGAPYRRLFGHTVRGASPAYETEYGSDDLFQQPRQLADLGGFYAAFGLEVAPDAHERADHVSCECEFLMILHRKEASALDRRDAVMLAETRKAIRLFVRDHLGRFVPGLSERVRRAEGDGFYARLADVADLHLRRECARLGVGAGPPTLHLRSPADVDVPMACGTCPVGPGAAEGADGD